MSAHRAGHRRRRGDEPPESARRNSRAGARAETPADAPATTTAVLDRPVPPPSGGRRAARRAEERAERQRRAKKAALAGLAGVAAVAVIAGAVIIGHGSGRSKHAAGVATGRTQHTLLVVLRGDNGKAVESALLAHDSRTGEGAVILVPSSVVSEVPGHGTMLFGNSTQFGSPTLAAETLSDLMGVTVDGQWTLDLRGLSTLVDQVGGIDVDQVTTDVVRTTTSGAQQVVVPAGSNEHLSGQQAVALATYRADGEEEQARLARLTSVLTGLLAALPADAGAATDDVTLIGKPIDRAMAPAQIGALLAGLAADNKAGNVVFETLPVRSSGVGNDSYTADAAQVQTLVQHDLAASVPAGRSGGHNRVIVTNGTGALGLGQSARKRLVAHGLVFVRSENEDGFTFRGQHSVVLVADGTAASRALGHRVAAALGLPDSDIAVTDSPTTAADVVAILGSDYKP